MWDAQANQHERSEQQQRIADQGRPPQRPGQSRRRDKNAPQQHERGAYHSTHGKLRLYGFPYNKHDLQPKHVEGLGAFMDNAHPLSDIWWKSIVGIRGHASPEGAEAHNEALAERRADAVVDHLILWGRIRDAGHGANTMSDDARRYLRGCVAPYGEASSANAKPEEYRWWRCVEVIYDLQHAEFDDDHIKSDGQETAEIILKTADKLKGEFPDHYIDDVKFRMRIVLSGGDTKYLSRRDVDLYLDNAMHQYSPEFVSSDVVDDLRILGKNYAQKGDVELTRMAFRGFENGIREGLQRAHQRVDRTLQNQNTRRLNNWFVNKQSDPRSILFNYTGRTGSHPLFWPPLEPDQIPDIFTD